MFQFRVKASQNVVHSEYRFHFIGQVYYFPTYWRDNGQSPTGLSFRSSLPVDLIKPVSMSVRPSTLFASDLNETWLEGRGQWVVHSVSVWLLSEVKVKVASLTKIVIRPTLRSISSQYMDHGYELASDFKTKAQYKIFLGLDFRYQSRVTWLQNGRKKPSQWNSMELRGP